MGTRQPVSLKHLQVPYFVVVTCNPCACRHFSPVYPNLNSGAKMNYEEHRSGYRRGLDAVDITGGKSTHLPRQSGSQKIIDSG